MAEQPAKQSHSRGHQHTKRCYWDYRECRWVCPAEIEPVSVGVGGETEQPCTS